MNEFAANFHFLRPWWLLALVLPVFFYWKYFRGMKSLSSWEKVCDKKLLDFLLIKGSSAQRKLVGFLSMLGFVTAITALAGPSWQKTAVPAMAPENPVMILLNLSSDMQAKDLQPSRLDRAKFKIRDLLAGLQSPQAGLIVYTNEPYLITPITDDTELIQNLLPAVQYDIMPENGDRLDRAIELAADKLKGAGYFNGNIIIFAPEAGQQLDKALPAARAAKDAGYKVSAVGVNKKTDEKLKLVTQYGGGLFVPLSGNDNDVLRLDKFVNDDISELKQSENKQSTWLDYGYYLTIIPLLCCLYFFRRGIVAVVVLLALSGNAHAGMWLNNNQEGLKAYQNGDYQQAAEKFEAFDWKGSAFYKLGDYDKALQNFTRGSDETALYNQGNALAKGGKIEEAIKKYEEVLKINPEHEDAKFNLEYLKKQQNQQNQNNQQNNQDNQDNKQDQQQSSSDSNNQQDENDEQNRDNNNGEDENNNRNDAQDNADNSQNNEDERQNQNSPQNDNRPEDNEQSGNEQQQAGNEQEKDNQKPKESDARQTDESDKGEDYNEETQARAQKFRDIPEDAGGLLKAFIYKEYQLNRYGE